MEKFISYLQKTYDVCGLIVYGSYADGSAGVNSDFDALVITSKGKTFHDTTVVDGVRLDVFIYPKERVEQGIDPEEVIQIFDGQILVDRDGLAQGLKQKVCEYLESSRLCTEEEVNQQINWCKKMLLRTQRADAEGMYRWHWLLTDSLEIFCNKCNCRYFGPKKALRWLSKNDEHGFHLYENALRNLDEQALKAWIDYLETK